MHPEKELIQHENLAATAVCRYLSCYGSVFFLKICLVMNEEVKQRCSAGMRLNSAGVPSRGSRVPSCRCPCALIACHLFRR